MRSALTSVALVGVAAALWPAVADGARSPTRCTRGNVVTRVTYATRAGGGKRGAIGCAPRPAGNPVSPVIMLRRLRAAALTFAPRPAVRALAGSAARRVLAADGVTDAALVARLRHTARAAGVTHESSGGPITGPPGTGTILHYDTTVWDSNERNVGQAYDVTSETTGKRLKQPGRKTKRITVKYLMNRCPDANGVAHGTLAFTLREVSTIGNVVLTETSSFDGTVDATFADNARIAAVHVDGRWSFATAGQASRRSVGGTVSATGVHQGAGGPPYSTFVDLKTTVTTGTDDGIATSGGYLGSYVTMVPELDLRETILDPLQSRVLGGVCVAIVADPPQVHVKPGATATITAHLTDQDAATFNGPMTAYNGSDRVTPLTTQAGPDATFTYTAPVSARAGDTDVVQLSHISRRGKARDGTVAIVVDQSLFPARFEGGWTLYRTWPNVRPGFREELHATATYVRSTAPPQPPHLSSVLYDVQSATVGWKVSGSDNPTSMCNNVYSGMGTTPGDETTNATSALTLEDVRGNPAAPSPEPSPFYYSIQSSGDPNSAPMYTDTHIPAGCAIDYQESISNTYLAVGVDGDFVPGFAADKIQRTADPRSLSGHIVTTDEFGYTIEVAWSFTGSG